MTTKLVGRVASWHWVRNRTERALARRSSSRVLHLLSHSNPRTKRAAMTHIALDVQHASNARLATPDPVTFPSLSDVELSRMSAASARERATAEAAALRQITATSAGASPLSHEHVRPASALSVVSAETTNSSDGGESSSACTPQRPQSPDGMVARPTPPSTKPGLEAPTAASNMEHIGESCIGPAAQASSDIANEVVLNPPVPTAGPEAVTHVRSQRRPRRRGPWLDGVPAEGRAACMLTQDAALWHAFVATLSQMLRSADVGQQHDAAFAVQVIAFSCERMAQKLIDAGLTQHPVLPRKMLCIFRLHALSLNDASSMRPYSSVHVVVRMPFLTDLQLLFGSSRLCFVQQQHLARRYRESIDSMYS